MHESPSDYSHLAHEVADVEQTVAKLLDEMVASIERSHPPDHIEERAKIIAHEARTVAQNLREKNALALNETLVIIEALEHKSEDLLAALPDTVVFEEQKKWAGELEAITAGVHRLKRSLELLNASHVQGRQKRSAQMALERNLAATKARLAVAMDGILHKKHARAHPTYRRIEKIQQALGRVKAHVGQKQQEARTRKIEGSSRMAADQIRQFFARELEGRMHVDYRTIRLTSRLTGRVAEYPLNEINAEGLHMVLDNPDAREVVDGARAGKCTLVADFACHPDADGLRVEMDAVERKIMADAIMAKPHKFRATA